MIGKTIPHYKILEKLGEGGMGVKPTVRPTKRIHITTTPWGFCSWKEQVNDMKSLTINITLIFFGLASAAAQEVARYDGPIIDMHFHGAFVFGEESVQPIGPWLDAFDSYNVKQAVLTAYPHHLAAWTRESPALLIPSLMFPCIQQFVRQCFADGENLLPDIAWLRGEIEAGRIKMLGEVVTERVRPHLLLAGANLK